MHGTARSLDVVTALVARIALATLHTAHCLFALRCFCVCFCAVAMHWHWQLLPFVHPQAEQRCQGQPCAATPPAHRRRGQCQGERYVRGLHDAHSCAQASSLTPRSQSQSTACSTVTLSYINAAPQLHRCEMMGIYGGDCTAVTGFVWVAWGVLSRC